MVVHYEADQIAGHWKQLPKLLCVLRGTVLPAVFKSPEFVILMGWHICCILLDRGLLYSGFVNGDDGMYADEDTKELIEGDGTPTVNNFFDMLKYQYAFAASKFFTVLPYGIAKEGFFLVTFFVVFYNTQTYNRYFTLYGHTVGIAGTLMEFTAMARGSLPDNPVGQWNAVRHMLCAQHLLYYTIFNEGFNPQLWETMRKRQIVTDAEVATLKAYQGFKPFLAVFWCLEECKAQIGRKQAKHKKAADEEAVAVAMVNQEAEQTDTSPRKRRLKCEVSVEDVAATFEEADPVCSEITFTEMQEACFKFRGHMGQIVNLIKEPIPFPYFNLVNLMIVINLLLFGWAITPMAWWPFTMVGMFIFTTVLIGMRSLAVQLANPFGDDLVDFECEIFLKGSYTNTLSMLQSPKPEAHLDREPEGITCPVCVAAPDGWSPGDVVTVKTQTGTAVDYKAPAKMWVPRIEREL